MKKRFLFVLIFFVGLVFFGQSYFKPNIAFASDTTEEEVEEELNDNIDDQLNNIDFNNLDDILNGLTKNERGLFGESSFLNLIKKFVSGENYSSNILEYVLGAVFDEVLDFLPFLAIIVAIAILYSLIGQFSSEKNKSISSLVHIVCFSSIVVIVLKMVMEVLISTTSTINLIQAQMEIIFPIILTLISAIGSVVTASTFQPILAILSVGIVKIFTTILIPIFIFSTIFNIIGNISKNVRLEKFSKFFLSLFNWIIGIIFTIFIAFLTIHGLTASSVDSISLKTAKFAIKSYVPILGSYLSDGVSLIVASSILIKNAIGATGLILLFATIFVPIIKIIILILALKLISAILEPLCEKEIPNFLFSISKSLNMLNICLIAIGFMYLISVSILMCCSNIF